MRNGDDLISLQAAIDALRMDIDIIPFAKAREYARAVIETVYNRLEELPSAQPEQRWIPVSERLPEEYEYVLLCDREPEPDEDTGYSRMAVGWLEGGRFCCWDDRAARKEFVAWMPLPEPYKEGEHE